MTGCTTFVDKVGHKESETPALWKPKRDAYICLFYYAQLAYLSVQLGQYMHQGLYLEGAGVYGVQSELY